MNDMQILKKYYIYIIIDILLIVFNFSLIHKPEWYFLLSIPFWFCLMILMLLNFKNILNLIIDRKNFNKPLFVNTLLLILLSLIPYNQITAYLNYKLNYQKRIEITEKIKKEIKEGEEKQVEVTEQISKNKRVIAIKQGTNICVIFNLSYGLMSTESKEYLIYTNVESKILQELLKERVISLNNFKTFEDSWYYINASVPLYFMEKISKKTLKNNKL